MYFAICDKNGKPIVQMSFAEAARLTAEARHAKRKRARSKTEAAVLAAFQQLKNDLLHT